MGRTTRIAGAIVLSTSFGIAPVWATGFATECCNQPNVFETIENDPVYLQGEPARGPERFDCGLGSLGRGSDEAERANSDPAACQGRPHSDVLHAHPELRRSGPDGHRGALWREPLAAVQPPGAPMDVLGSRQLPSRAAHRGLSATRRRRRRVRLRVLAGRGLVDRSRRRTTTPTMSRACRRAGRHDHGAGRGHRSDGGAPDPRHDLRGRAVPGRGALTRQARVRRG